MTANGWLQVAIFFALIVVCTKPLGTFIATVMEGRKNFLSPVLGPRRAPDLPDLRRQAGRGTAGRAALDALCRRRCWPSALFSAVLLYAMQRLQVLPFNPQGFSAGM